MGRNYGRKTAHKGAKKAPGNGEHEPLKHVYGGLMENNSSSRFQKSQEVIDSMNDKRLVFVGKTTALVALSIIGAFALLVCLDSPVKTSSLPAGKALADLQYLNAAGNSLTENHVTDGINQGVKLASAVPANGEPIADKVSDKCTYNTIRGIFNDTHYSLQTKVILCLCCFIVGLFIGYFRS